MGRWEIGADFFLTGCLQEAVTVPAPRLQLSVPASFHRLRFVDAGLGVVGIDVERRNECIAPRASLQCSCGSTNVDWAVSGSVDHSIPPTLADHRQVFSSIAYDRLHGGREVVEVMPPSERRNLMSSPRSLQDDVPPDEDAPPQHEQLHTLSLAKKCLLYCKL